MREERKTHALIMMSGVHHLITEKQYQGYLNCAVGEEFMLGNLPVKYNSVADAVDIELYYQTFPKRRPPQMQMFENNPMLSEPKKELTDNPVWLEQMIIGLKKYINSTELNPVMPNGRDPRWYKGGKEPQEKLAEWEKKLALLRAK